MKLGSYTYWLHWFSAIFRTCEYVRSRSILLPVAVIPENSVKLITCTVVGGSSRWRCTVQASQCTHTVYGNKQVIALS